MKNIPFGYKILIILVLFVIGCFIISNFSFIENENNFVGEAYKSNLGIESSNKPKCTDSDGNSSNPGFVYGITEGFGDTGLPVTGHDFCISEGSDSYIEYFCEGELVMGIMESCPPNFFCLMGRCINQSMEKPPLPNPCSDSDLDSYGSYKIYEKGITSGIYNSGIYIEVEDFCIDKDTVREYSCTDRYHIQYLELNCPGPGNGCENGACKFYECQDTDPENSLFVAGMVNGTIYPSGVSYVDNFQDQCVTFGGPTKVVSEGTCVDGGATESLEFCPGDLWCEEGICVEKTLDSK